MRSNPIKIHSLLPKLYSSFTSTFPIPHTHSTTSETHTPLTPHIPIRWSAYAIYGWPTLILVSCFPLPSANVTLSSFHARLAKVSRHLPLVFFPHSTFPIHSFPPTSRHRTRYANIRCTTRCAPKLLPTPNPITPPGQGIAHRPSITEWFS
jgi:hypothetical protein